MFADLLDLLPVLFAAAAAVLIPLLLVRAVGRRKENCGDRHGNCLWCDRECDYYRLDKV